MAPGSNPSKLGVMHTWLRATLAMTAIGVTACGLVLAPLCVVLTDGHLRCWGENAIEPGSNYMDIAVGHCASCALEPAPPAPMQWETS